LRRSRAEAAAWELLPELEQQEFRIRQRLEPETALLLRTGVAMIDYAVDQIRFFLEARRSLKAAGLTDLDALDRAELLTLPECLHHAKTAWQRERLLALAVSRQWRLWQRVLFARHPNMDVGLLRRDAELAGQCIQLWPYPASVAIPPAAVLPLLEASVTHDHGLRPSPVHPIRSLQPGLCWSLQLDFFHLQRVHRGNCCLTVIIDPPWDFDLVQVVAALRARADEVEAGIEAARYVPHPPPEEVIRQWRAGADALRADVGRLAQVNPSERAAILHRWFAQPETMYLSPIAFVTEDMPPDVMAELMGSQLKAVGLLSVREARRFDEFVVARLLKDRPDLRVEEAREVGARLAHFQRPLRQRSVSRYEAKVVKGVRIPRPARPRLRKQLQRIAAKHMIHERTVYQRFRTFIETRGLRRDAAAVKRFARSVRPRGPSRPACVTASHT
jgi:hypothetical protein